MTRSSGNSLAQRLIALIKEFMQFGMVGAAAYVVGFGLGTAFRFVFYHYIVFTGHKDHSPGDDDTDSTSPQGQAGSGTEPRAVPVSVRP